VPIIEPLLQCKLNQAAFWWPPKVLSGKWVSKKPRARSKEHGTVWHGIGRRFGCERSRVRVPNLPFCVSIST
jgi:hypothetical protein